LTIKGKGVVSILQDNLEKFVFKEIEHSAEKWLELIEKNRMDKKNPQTK
jgi:hypothetical protein